MTEQIAAIEAAERLATISDMGVGNGTVKKSDRDKHIRTLKRMAKFDRGTPATPGELNAIGIPVVRV